MLASAALRKSPGQVALMLASVWLSCSAIRPFLCAADSAASAGELYEVWGSESTWPQSSVTAIVQTRDGYLWLGTYHGLVRFDGVSFTVFDSGNTPGLRDGRITSLYESPDWTLWIGHETGELTRRAAGQFQSVNLGSNWTGGVIEAMASDEQDEVWLLNDSGTLFRVRDGRTDRTPGGASPLRRATLARSTDGRLWVSSNGKVATLNRGNVVDAGLPAPETADGYERVFAARDGGIWVLGNGRLRNWRDGGWTRAVEGFPRTPAAVNVMVETRTGLLVGTMRDGLYLLRPGCEPLHFSRTNGLSHDWVRALCVDQEGNNWVGTGTGFDGLRVRKVRMVAPPDGWQGCAVRSFNIRASGSAWVGTEGAGLYRYDGQGWTVFGTSAGLHNHYVWSVLETRQQELFVGTWGGGLFHRTGERFESSGELGRISAPVAALYQGRGGELWIGTQEGLHRYEGGKLVWFAGREKLALPDVRAITETPEGALWFGMSGGGLGTLRDGVLKQYRQRDGLGSDLINCLYADADGTLWIGTTDNGLTRLARGKFSTISAAEGLPDKIICHIVDDGAGHLWLGTKKGIVRVGKADLHQCADGQARFVHCLSYGRAEGLAVEACTGGFQPGACRTADGRLWFPTVKGLAVVDPAKVTTNSVPPPVVIEALFVDGATTNNWMSRVASVAADSPAAVRTPLRIPPGHRRFEFKYTGLSFMAPDKVRFRHRLEGLESDWVEAGVKRVAEYSYLPPGTYTFKVIACNNDEVWNEVGDAVTFKVLPYFWQTLWFRVGAMIAGAVALAAGTLWVARRRLRRKLELSERQRALERERARIARDIHDDLGASLTRISMLSQSVRGEVGGLPHAAAEVDQIHGTAREITRAMDEIVWAVNPKHDTLDSLVAYLGRFAQLYLSTTPIRCRLHVPVDPPPLAVTAEVRHNVFLAFKEALHNVVKHAHASEVWVSLELRPTEFELLVADDGRGFNGNADPSPAGAADDALRSAAGNGLLNMRKRLEEIGGRCEWETAPGKGTRVRFTVGFKAGAA